MRADKQTSKHLLLAVVVTMVGMMLMLITIAFSWELWMVPIFVIGNGLVWFLHIGRIGSKALYENLCSGLLLIGFFFFGVHSVSLFDIPAVACIVFLIFSMLDKTLPLYMIAALYIVELLYHGLILHTITSSMDVQDVIRLGLGAVIVAGALSIAKYRINRRIEERQWYAETLTQLETVEQQNAEFLSNVSHELRTPVNMVLGISEVALGKKLSPELRGDVPSIQTAGKRLSNQISKILDYTEIVEGTLAASSAPYTIISVLNDVITSIMVQNSKRHLELIFDIDPKIPAVLVGDAEKISHVMKILLENSIKFTEEGGVGVSVGFRRENYGINLIIDVYDTGIGMTESQIAQIDDDFYQANSGSNRFAGGLGLGIPIARGLLQSMGGFIHFDSKEEQRGLQARMIIPQGMVDDTPAMVVTDVEQLCVACYFKPEKFACDEVSQYYDRLISHLLEGLGLEGYQAHNFEGFLKLLSNHNLTHVFIAQSEYEENGAYYEELANSMRVAVIAEKDFSLDRESNLLVIHKPFFAISVVNLLNGDISENSFDEMQAAGHRPFSCEGVRVLVVDDEEMNLVVARGFLDSYGIQVDTCLSGKEAVKQCTQAPYDMIFLDHMMPGFDGIETLRRIREIENGAYQDLPVIALTANTISGAREMFRDEGFTEFVAKPIERTVLERVLRRVLPKHCIHYNNSNATEEDTPVPADAEEEYDSLQEEAVPEAGQPAGQSAALSMTYAALAEVGIDVAMGLDYCCGDDAFYLDMLRMFSGQRQEKAEEIMALYEAANWPDYAVKVHALKSTSLTIGATELSALAKQLEHAGKEEDTEYIHENHPILLRMYEEVCESMTGV